MLERLGKAIEEHLRLNEIRYQRHDCGSMDAGYVAGFRGTNVGLMCSIHAHEEHRYLTVTVFSGVKARPERLQAAYEVAQRINNSLAIGGFAVEPDEGDVRFEIAASLLEIEPTDTWLGSMIQTALHTYDRFFPALSNVLYADADPAEALARAAGPSDDEVTESVAKLFSDADEAGEEPATFDEPTGDDDDLDS